MTTAAGRTLAVVDLQRVVGPGQPWAVPGLDATLPAVRALLDAFGSQTVLTRHRLAPHGPGRWQHFARRWAHLDGSSHWQLLDDIADAVPAGADVVDKTTYSAFRLAPLAGRLRRGHAPELVLAGCETDCCIAATLYEAVDAGVAVTVVEDAVAGPDRVAHAGLLAAARRLPEQVRVASAREAISRPFVARPAIR